MARSTQTTVTIGLDELEKMIRKIVRRDVRQVVREELARAGADVVEPWMSDPESPLYQDMNKLGERKSKGNLEFHSYDEVFSK